MPQSSYSERQNYGQYGLGDYVYDEVNAFGYMFKCVDLIKSSGYNTPDISLLTKGDFVVDGSIVWVIKDRSDYYPDWESMTNYRLGDSVNIGSSEYSLECISYTGTVGTSSEVSFELTQYPVIGTGDNYFRVNGNKTFYFRPNDQISVSYIEGQVEQKDQFQVKGSVYDIEQGYTTITVTKNTGISSTTASDIVITTTARGTRDGQILWSLIDDIDNITYPWNGYMVFDHVLNIIN